MRQDLRVEARWGSVHRKAPRREFLWWRDGRGDGGQRPEGRVVQVVVRRDRVARDREVLLNPRSQRVPRLGDGGRRRRHVRRGGGRDGVVVPRLGEGVGALPACRGLPFRWEDAARGMGRDRSLSLCAPVVLHLVLRRHGRLAFSSTCSTTPLRLYYSALFVPTASPEQAHLLLRCQLPAACVRPVHIKSRFWRPSPDPLHAWAAFHAQERHKRDHSS